MKKAIYLRFVIIIIISVLFCGLASAVMFEVNEENQTKLNLSQLTYAVSYQYEINQNAAYLSSVAGGDRVTIISSGGNVLDDSETNAGTMENHGGRDEVKNAKKGVVVTSGRRSETLGAHYMYAAIKMEDGNILRISRRYSGFFEGCIRQIPGIFLPMIIAMLLAVFISRSFTKKLTLPLEKSAELIAAGEYDELGEDKKGYYEIDRIVNQIKHLIVSIELSNKELVFERDKINFILSSMAEGFILLDENKTILLINSSAEKIFNCNTSVISQNILMLTRNPKIEKAVNEVIKSTISSIFDLEFEDKTVSVHVSPVFGNPLFHEGNGITILFVDVTAERKSGQIRSEFFTNASHELKTPITSILGFSEMLEHGLTDSEKTQEIYKRIGLEARKMSRLINDILTVSRLESGVTDDERENININEIISQVVSTLLPQTQALNIKINLDSEDILINASRRRIYELICNLMENAVKYNKLNGSINISAQVKMNKLILKVNDTGIGIPVKDHKRIFERFYRSDNGRAKDTGGTGLGLSIVKHIVLNMGGNISLESKVDEGTKILVELPLGL